MIIMKINLMIVLKVNVNYFKKNNYYKLILKFFFKNIYLFIIINKNKLKIEVSNNILKVLNKIYMKVKFDIFNFI